MVPQGRCYALQVLISQGLISLGFIPQALMLTSDSSWLVRWPQTRFLRQYHCLLPFGCRFFRNGTGPSSKDAKGLTVAYGTCCYSSDQFSPCCGSYFGEVVPMKGVPTEYILTIVNIPAVKSDSIFSLSHPFSLGKGQVSQTSSVNCARKLRKSSS